MLEPERLQALVQAQLPDAELELEDLTGTRDHYRLTVVSAHFAGLTPLQRHRLVYKALQQHVGAEIHALSLSTLSRDEREPRST